MSAIVIVESPAKAKTIEKFLGKGYKVVATYGHIRDLPSKSGSVDTENDFEMSYEVSKQSTKHVTELAKHVKGLTRYYSQPILIERERQSPGMFLRC